MIARGAGGRETLRIDAGTERGVASGLAVVGANGVVGQVLDAGTGWADVLCVTDPSAGLAGAIEGGPHGTLRGTRTGLAMDHVLARHAIVPGMRVIATGEGGLFPAGALVGVVTRAEPDPGTPFLAGSGHFLDSCVAKLASLGECPLADAVDMAGAAPRALLGLPAVGLKKGAPADVILYEVAPFRVVKTVVNQAMA